MGLQFDVFLSKILDFWWNGHFLIIRIRKSDLQPIGFGLASSDFWRDSESHLLHEFHFGSNHLIYDKIIALHQIIDKVITTTKAYYVGIFIASHGKIMLQLAHIMGRTTLRPLLFVM